MSIICTCRESYDAAVEMSKPGRVPMLVWHDDNDSFECTGSIPGISVINSLSKTFPFSGKYAGGMILRLYNGIGAGIKFTKAQVKKLLGGNTFEGVVRMYESPSSSLCGSLLPSKQRRALREKKAKQLQNKKTKRKMEVERLNSFNTAKIRRIEASAALVTARRPIRKLTFTQASQRVVDHAKSPSNACKPCSGNENTNAKVCNIFLLCTYAPAVTFFFFYSARMRLLWCNMLSCVVAWCNVVWLVSGGVMWCSLV